MGQTWTSENAVLVNVFPKEISNQFIVDFLPSYEILSQYFGDTYSREMDGWGHSEFDLQIW